MSRMQWKQLLSPNRLGSASPGVITPERSPFQRDFDRVIFSGSFRRLQNKTQVFPLVQEDYVRTRLTHSLETSSIGRSLGTAAGVFLKKNYDLGDAQVSDVGAIVATAALSHDIGNPPLGHAGEEAIRYWFTTSAVAKELQKELMPEQAKDFELYEGNAQGFRVLSVLEMADQCGGMQLTSATLGSFAKYPATASALIKPPGVAGKKFNFFQAEKELFAEVAANCGLIEYGPYAYARHPLAYLVEAADDIAYLAVDFEDGARLGLISQDEVESRYLSILPDTSAASHLSNITNPVRRTEYLRALVIGELVRETTKVFCDHCDEILEGGFGAPLTEHLPCAPQLKEVRERSVKLIYNNRKVSEIIGAGFEMVSGMLDIFVPSINELAAEKLGKGNASYRSRRMGAVVTDLTEKLNDSAWCADPYARLLTVMDFISGMTDSYAVSIYRKLKGITL